MLSELDFRILLDTIEAKASGTLSGVTRQLKPIGWKRHLCYDGIWDRESNYILDGVINGFHVVNRNVDIQDYIVGNYLSCFERGVEEKLSSLIESEISAGKLSLSVDFSRCIHALGAVRKSTGSYRPITYCSRLLEIAVNNHMEEVFNRFSFVSLNQFFLRRQ